MFDASIGFSQVAPRGDHPSRPVDRREPARAREPFMHCPRGRQGDQTACNSYSRLRPSRASASARQRALRAAHAWDGIVGPDGDGTAEKGTNDVGDEGDVWVEVLPDARRISRAIDRHVYRFTHRVWPFQAHLHLWTKP